MGYLLFFLYIVLGIINAYYILDREKPLRVLWAGGVLGLVFLMWSHVPFSFIFGFSILSHILGFLSILIWTTVFFCIKSHFVFKSKTIKEIMPKFRMLDMEETSMLLLVFAMTLFCVLCLNNHTLNEINGGYFTGQCTYGDMNFHLGIITSIKEQGTFPPDYNIFPGQRLDYYFLSNSISSSLYLFGCNLRMAYMLPMYFAFALTFAGFWHLAYAVLKRSGKAIVAFILFFFNGGFGLMYFLDGLNAGEGSDYNFKRIFTQYYETPTNYVNNGERLTNIRWTNTIVDMMIPQRATLFGWMVLFFVLYLLYMAVFEDKKSYFLPAGIIGGLLPMIQTYSFFTLGVVAFVWLVYSIVKSFKFQTFKNWFKFGIPAVALAIPQFMIWIFSAVSEDRFLRFEFNAYNETDNWLWFWVKNVGIVFILVLPAFFSADRRMKIVHAAGAAIFVICEFIVFQTFSYDNNKLYLMWYVFAVLLVSDFLVNCYDKLRSLGKSRTIITVMLLVVCTASAFFTMARELNSGMKGKSYQLYSKDHIAAAEFINENTEADSLFMCYNNHNNTVSCLTGRNIFTGSGTFLYSHGVNYQGRADILKDAFTDEKRFEQYKEEYGFDYVFISSYERNNYKGIIEDYFEKNYKLVFSQGEVKIYALT